LLASTYCLHFLNQTIAEVTPVTVPVWAGEFNGALNLNLQTFKSNAGCVHLKLVCSNLVLFTFPNQLKLPVTVPVKAGEFLFWSILFCLWNWFVQITCIAFTDV
jgi:hypothetical protein